MARPKLKPTHNLQLDSLALELDGANLEVYADGCEVRRTIVSIM